MVDIHTIIADHTPRKRRDLSDVEASETAKSTGSNIVIPTISEIPDIFFDDILVELKLGRVEIMVIMYLYRRVWCRPNLYKVHGISQLLSHTEMAKSLHLSIEDIYQALRKLEHTGFISTVRSGQYFVRKYFTREWDEKYGQTYDDFEI